MKRANGLQTPTVFWPRGGTISHSYWMYMGLMMLGTQKYIQQSLVPEPCASEFKMATGKLRHKSPGTDHIPAELMQGVKKFGLRSINLLILFEIRRNCPRSGRSWSLYLFIKRVLNQTVLIIEAHLFVDYVQNFIQHPAVKVNSIHLWFMLMMLIYW